MKLENVYMLLPNRTVGYGTIEISGGKISKIDIETPSHNAYHLSLNTKPILVMPGLVNAHGHTAMTLVRGLGGGLPLKRWLEEAIFPVEAKMTKEDVAAGTMYGAMEMLMGGTTEVVDMYDFPGECEQAFEEIGMKAHVSRVGLSFIPGRLEEAIEFTRRHDKAHICIHSEYLTNEEYCRALAKVNNEELKRPLHVHVSETEKEHAECLERHGKTPIKYLADLGLLDQGGFAAHCVYCTDEDFKIMAEKGMVLVHNPTSNMKLGSGFARIPRAMELGVKVALGTDGCASNDNLDMFEEMHIASLIHKGLAKDPTVLSAWDVIEMATYGNAIEVGHAADLCVVDLNKIHLFPILSTPTPTPTPSIPNLVVNSMHASDVVMTIVDGEIVYDNGQWLKINHERAVYDFRCAVRRLFK